MKLLAHAKTNLFLRVLRKRNDNYHEIFTRMIRLSLADQIEINKINKKIIKISCNVDKIPRNENNLAYKAADLFLKKANIKQGFSIKLEKNIPHEAGLGGGSSNAAAVLLAMKKIFPNALNEEQILKIAAQIGADVPFFLNNCSCDCSGRGEIIKKKPDFDWELPIVIIKPNFQINTKNIYQLWQSAKKLPGISYAQQICPWGNLINDLEVPAFQKFPILAIMKQWLLEQEETHAVLLSGSGSALIAYQSKPFGGQALAERVMSKFGKNTWTFVGQTIA